MKTQASVFASKSRIPQPCRGKANPHSKSAGAKRRDWSFRKDAKPGLCITYKP